MGVRLGVLVLTLTFASQTASAARNLTTLSGSCASRLHDVPSWIQRVEKDPVLSRHASTITKILLNPNPAGYDPIYLGMVKSIDSAVRSVDITNSAKSVDEPIVSMPILLSLAELMGSDLHPRSLRYEGETANVIFDSSFAKGATEDFEKDLASATRVESLEALGIPKSKAFFVANSYFRDQL